MIDAVLQDIRYALRWLRKSPGFTLVAVLTLALGIGANTAIFTLVHAVLLKNLPVVDPNSLVRLGDNEYCCNLNLSSMGPDYTIFSYPGYKYLRDHTPEFDQLAAMQAGMADLSVRRAATNANATPRSAFGEFVSGNYFQTFGIQPYAGRVLSPADDTDAAAPVAVISYQTWQHDFAGDPSIIGSTFLMNTHPVTIIGVTPPAFYGDRMSTDPPGFFLPISQQPTLGSSPERDEASLGWLFLIGRVKPGTSLPTLQAKLSGLQQQALSTLPDMQTAYGKTQLAKAHIVLTPGGLGIANMQHQAANSLYLLMALAGLVLLIACANIANLLLVRGMGRRAETSIRLALGAFRARIIRQMLTESIVLACLGGLAGIVVAYGATSLLLALMFTDAPGLPIHAAPSLPVLGFAFAVSLLTGLLFGVAPAWLTSREEPADAMRVSSRTTKSSSSLLQRSLVVLQAALSIVLLIGAGLLGKSLNNLEHRDFGLDASNRVIVNLNPLKAGYKPEQLQGLYQQIEDKFHAMPGVQNIGLSLYTPLQGTSWSFWVFAQGEPEPAAGHFIGSSFNRANPDYFRSVGQRIIRGRAFTDADTATAPAVAIVNQAFVKRLFKPGENPIGRRIGAGVAANSSDYEIVGVVDNTKYVDAHEENDPPMFFLPLLQPGHFGPKHLDSAPAKPAAIDASLYAQALVLQMNALTPDLELNVRKTLAEIDPNLTVDHYATFASQISGNFTQERMISRLTLTFGLLALVLASVGLYGITSYGILRRTSEIGIRMALGAERTSVVSMVLRGSMLQCALGILIGIPIALLCAHFVTALSTLLFGVQFWDLTVLSLATLSLSFAAVIAGIIPARRAASIQPMDALRTE